MGKGPRIAGDEKFAAAEVGVRTLYQMQYQASLAQTAAVMTLSEEMPTDGEVEDFFILGDVPMLEEWADDRMMGSIAGGKFRITNKDFATGIKIHKNAIADDKLGKYKSVVSAMGRRAAWFPADRVAKMLINGFSGTAFPKIGDGLAFDGSLFFSANHVFDGGVAQSNLLGAVALSDANLEAAEIKLGNLTTWDGAESLGLNGTHLIVGKKLQAQAMKLVNANVIINAAGTAAADNPFLRGRYEVMVLPQLVGTYDDYWFLADLSQPTKPTIHMIREALQERYLGTESQAFFDHGVVQYGIDGRFGFGLWDWRTIVGANPA